MLAHEASRRALAAVARLTFIAGAAGCGGTVTVETNEPPDTTGAGESQTGALSDIPIYPLVPPSACFEGATGAEACCSDLLASAFSDDHLFQDPTLATDEQKACCDLAVTVLDTWAGTGEPPFDFGTAHACCSAGLVEDPWGSHPSCTPWGPPMPPAMPPPLEVLA